MVSRIGDLGWAAGSYQMEGRARDRGWMAGSMKVTSRTRVLFSTKWSSSMASTACATMAACFSCMSSILLTRAMHLSSRARTLSWKAKSSWSLYYSCMTS